MDKRGISPIIATLLLISFAVAVGLVVMNFGRAQVELEAECAIDINLKFANIGGQQDICFDQVRNQLRFTLENGVNIDVKGVIVNVIGTQKADSFNLNTNMGKAATYMGGVAYNRAVSGDIRQIKITPKVVLYDTEQICTAQALITEKVRNC